MSNNSQLVLDVLFPIVLRGGSTSQIIKNRL